MINFFQSIFVYSNFIQFTYRFIPYLSYNLYKQKKDVCYFFVHLFHNGTFTAIVLFPVQFAPYIYIYIYIYISKFIQLSIFPAVSTMVFFVSFPRISKLLSVTRSSSSPSWRFKMLIWRKIQLQMPR